MLVGLPSGFNTYNVFNNLIPFFKSIFLLLKNEMNTFLLKPQFDSKVDLL